MLRGNALVKVDGKGRLKLPAAFRAIIEPTWGVDFFVTSINGESVQIFPTQVYADLEQRVLKASSLDPSVERFRTLVNFYGQSATMDSQGRILIHPLVRTKAGIDGSVAVLGVGNYLDVWNQSIIERRLEPLTAEEKRSLAALGL